MRCAIRREEKGAWLDTSVRHRARSWPSWHRQQLEPTHYSPIATKGHTDAPTALHRSASDGARARFSSRGVPPRFPGGGTPPKRPRAEAAHGMWRTRVPDDG